MIGHKLKVTIESASPLHSVPVWSLWPTDFSMHPVSSNVMLCQAWTAAIYRDKTTENVAQILSDLIVMSDTCPMGVSKTLTSLITHLFTPVYMVCYMLLVLCNWCDFLCLCSESSISLLSRSNWDTASHCRGDFLFGHGFLRCLLEMIRARLDWKWLDGCRLGMDSSLCLCANPCCGTPLGLHDWWNPICPADPYELLASAAPFWWLGTIKSPLIMCVHYRHKGYPESPPQLLQRREPDGSHGIILL